MTHAVIGYHIITCQVSFAYGQIHVYTKHKWLHTVLYMYMAICSYVNIIIYTMCKQGFILHLLSNRIKMAYS